MWRPIGFAVVDPFISEIAVGHLSAVLPDGLLILRLAYLGGGNLDPLSFLIADFLDDSGFRSLGSEKWWPRPQPSTVRLGPGAPGPVSGVVLLRLRSYNAKWLQSGLPAPSFPIGIAAWLPDGQTVAKYLPLGFNDGYVLRDGLGEPVGPGGARPVMGENG